VSTFTLERDCVVVPSTFLDELERSGLSTIEQVRETTRVFEYEALGLEPVEIQGVSAAARGWAERRLARIRQDDRRFHGATSGYTASSWSLSAIERYQECPFKFFAADVLRLEEIPEGDTLSPRARGRFVHEVFQRFFEEWDRRGDRTLTSERVNEARSVFEELAEPLLARLSETDAALERTRLFGSAVAVGIVDVVLGLEASRAAPVRERWLEHRFHGEFTLGTADGRRVSLKGVADRVDLLEDRRLRVIDYKSGYPPAPQRALQVPIYALCAQEELLARDGHPWQVEEAAYVAFAGKRALVPVVKPAGDDGESILSAARSRLLTAIDGIEGGEFPPRPHDPAICNYCSFASVCRKDYVGDDAPQ
jgi:ATP-dependent helicase/nuclease subunit B